MYSNISVGTVVIWMSGEVISVRRWTYGLRIGNPRGCKGDSKGKLILPHAYN
jgi:hypothetical protein